MLVAIGPRASEALAVGHPDLVLIEEVQPEAFVCMFDVRDEAWWWQVTRRVREFTKPRWLVVAADPWRYRALMCGVARDLECCVVLARPEAHLRAALLPLAGLVRVGCIGIDQPAIAHACAAPSIALASFSFSEDRPTETRDADDWGSWRTDSALIVVRDADTSLSQINDLCERVVECHADADIVVTAPLFDHDVDTSLSAAGLLAIERLT